MPYYITNNSGNGKYRSNGMMDGETTSISLPAAEYSSESDATAAISSLGLSGIKVIFATSFAAAESTP